MCRLLTEFRLFAAEIRLSDAINSGNRIAESDALADIARIDAELRPLSSRIDMRDDYELTEQTSFVNEPGRFHVL